MSEILKIHWTGWTVEWGCKGQWTENRFGLQDSPQGVDTRAAQCCLRMDDRLKKIEQRAQRKTQTYTTLSVPEDSKATQMEWEVFTTKWAGRLDMHMKKLTNYTSLNIKDYVIKDTSLCLIPDSHCFLVFRMIFSFIFYVFMTILMGKTLLSLKHNLILNNNHILELFKKKTLMGENKKEQLKELGM